MERLKKEKEHVEWAEKATNSSSETYGYFLNQIHFIIDIDLLGFFKAYWIFRFFRLTNYFFERNRNPTDNRNEYHMKTEPETETEKPKPKNR